MEIIKIPDIGSFEQVSVIEILVKAGDSVNIDDPLITLESDKASMDIPAPLAGKVVEVLVKMGDQVAKGTSILSMMVEKKSESPLSFPEQKTGQENFPPSPTQKNATHENPATTNLSQQSSAPHVHLENKPNPIGESYDFSPQKLAHASPSIRKLARKLGVNLALVSATGKNHRVLQEDVENFVKKELNKTPQEAVTQSAWQTPTMPVIDFSQFGNTTTQALSRIKKRSGANLHRNWLTVPHVTQFDQADITDLEAFRRSMLKEAEKKGVKLTLLAFMMKAVVNALRTYPIFNASISTDGETLILKQYFHIGFACDTPDGLVVPVVRDVNLKDVLAIAHDLGELSQSARERKLKIEEMQGGCFTISSLGGIGGTSFTPIVNCPEVAILGISRATYQPIFNETTEKFDPRLMLPMSLSYDHRVIDGADGARFTSHLRMLLSDVRRLLL